jgi:5-formaminoimidazole-4-carboxamide-1-(beta)-D-ribofuranosyl 5'-monophosphate synthetase
MVELDAIQEIIANYDKKNINIATIGSHSALNIFKGAKDENFKTLCLCEEKRKATYDHFPIIDEYIMLNQMKDILKTDIQEKLRFKNSIIIPHGSFNAYVGSENIEESFEVPIFGNRALLTWESHREMQNEWLKKAGVSVPKTFNSPEDINTLTITKFPRAKGGRGYFISNNKRSNN